MFLFKVNHRFERTDLKTTNKAIDFLSNRNKFKFWKLWAPSFKKWKEFQFFDFLLNNHWSTEIELYRNASHKTA